MKCNRTADIDISFHLKSRYILAYEFAEKKLIPLIQKQKTLEK